MAEYWEIRWQHEGSIHNKVIGPVYELPDDYESNNMDKTGTISTGHNYFIIDIEHPEMLWSYTNPVVNFIKNYKLKMKLKEFLL